MEAAPGIWGGIPQSREILSFYFPFFYLFAKTLSRNDDGEISVAPLPSGPELWAVPALRGQQTDAKREEMLLESPISSNKQTKQKKGFISITFSPSQEYHPPSDGPTARQTGVVCTPQTVHPPPPFGCDLFAVSLLTFAAFLLEFFLRFLASIAFTRISARGFSRPHFPLFLVAVVSVK